MKNVLEIGMDSCTGCGSCINSCPVHALSYSQDEYGFIIPKIDAEKCIDCGKCVKQCPREGNVELNEPIEAYAAVNKCTEDIIRCSSGGVFPEVAKYVLLRGGSVYGCTMNKDYQVYHTKISSLNELAGLCRSKYIQSFMGKIYKSIEEDLDDKKWVLVSGTPCIIAGIKTFLGQRDISKLILIDVVCHGIPSQRFFDSYIKYLNQKYKGISSYEFRTKLKAKNGMNWLHSYYINCGKRRVIRNWPEDSYNYLYMNSYIYRESCYRCDYARLQRVGDITLCDYWGWEKYHRLFDKEASVSGVIINTLKGIEVWNGVRDNFVFEATDFINIAENNGCLKEPSHKPNGRERLLDEWIKKGYRTIDEEFRQGERINILKNKLFRKAPNWIKRLYTNMNKK